MRRIRATATVSVAILIVGLGALPAWGATAGTRRVSIATGGGEGGKGSYQPSITADGRFVAFSSEAPDLVAGDDNSTTDVFVRNLRTGRTRRVSISTGGAQGSDRSYGPSISADGRFVAFHSYASNLIERDDNRAIDVFVRDRLRGRTARVSVGRKGAERALGGSSPSISSDGRHVAFASANGDAGTSYGAKDYIFVRDRRLGKTTQVSVASDGAEANKTSLVPSISATGRYVAFISYASNLVAGDTNRARDAFVHDRRGGVTTRASVATGGTEANGLTREASISPDGRYVAFTGFASNLVAGDDNGYEDIFVRDLAGGLTTRVSVTTGGTEANAGSGEPAISAGGRFVTFYSYATNLVGVDDNKFDEDVFMRDLGATPRTTRVSVATAGAQGNNRSFVSDVSADGRFVTFDSFASNLVAADTNRAEDIFVRGPLAPQ